MLQRIITSLIIIALVIPPLFFGGILLKVLIFTIVAVSSYEMVTLRKKESNWPLAVFTFLATAIMYKIDNYYFVSALVIYIIILFLIVILNEKYNISDICFIFIVSIILTLAAKGVSYIYDSGAENMVYVILACYVTDTMAYFSGYKFGKIKMIPRISPKKTWEGAFGGYVSSFVVSLSYAIIFTKINFSLALILSLTLPVIAQVGDLAFSVIKRNYNVKDFGTIFPGHGGVLDRIDSLLFCIICYYAIAIIYFSSIQVNL